MQVGELSNSGVPRGRDLGVQTPSPEIPKAFQIRAKLSPIVKTVKKLLNLGRQHPKMFGKKGSKILKLPRFAIVLL